MKREGIKEVIKRRVIERDGYTCRYCGVDCLTPGNEYHFDHVYPVSKGGETSVDNLVIACRSCNLRKHANIGVWPKPVGYFGETRRWYPPLKDLEMNWAKDDVKALSSKVLSLEEKLTAANNNIADYKRGILDLSELRKNELDKSMETIMNERAERNDDNNNHALQTFFAVSLAFVLMVGFLVMYIGGGQ